MPIVIRERRKYVRNKKKSHINPQRTMLIIGSELHLTKSYKTRLLILNGNRHWLPTAVRRRHVCRTFSHPPPFHSLSLSTPPLTPSPLSLLLHGQELQDYATLNVIEVE